MFCAFDHIDMLNSVLISATHGLHVSYDCKALLGTLKRQRIVAKYICCLQTNTRLERKTITSNHDVLNCIK